MWQIVSIRLQRLSFSSFPESRPLIFFSIPPLGTRATVAVEYAVAIGTLAAAISVAFTGLGGRLILALEILPI